MHQIKVQLGEGEPIRVVAFRGPIICLVLRPLSSERNVVSEKRLHTDNRLD